MYDLFLLEVKLSGYFIDKFNEENIIITLFSVAENFPSTRAHTVTAPWGGETIKTIMVWVDIYFAGTNYSQRDWCCVPRYIV